MDLREVLAALRAAWWLPVVGVIVGSAAALGASLAQTPLYTSYTQLFVSTTAATSASDVLQGGQFSQQRVITYAQLLTGHEMAGRVIARLNLDLTPKQLAGEISATAVTDTVLIDVTVTDPSPEQARNIADALGTEFPGFVNQLESQRGRAASPIEVGVTDRPEVPDAPSSPKTRRNVALGCLAGLLLGSAGAITRARLDRSVKDEGVASELADAPVIGTVFRDEALRTRHIIHSGSSSRTTENYRKLRTNLQFVRIDEPPKVIMVSSAMPSEGKTTAVVNLGLVLADAGQRVVIVEADLRHPKVAPYMGLLGDAGLTDILTGNAQIEDVTQRYSANLSVITSGPLPPNPGELLGSSHMSAVLDKLRGQNDVVLIDTPPLLPVADSTALAVAMDGVLLSVRYGSTRKDQLRKAAEALDRVGATILGVILNIVPPVAGTASAYGYGSSYSNVEQSSRSPFRRWRGASERRGKSRRQRGR